jgi:tetratricopeptide (TPR) repeat protein
MKKLMVLILVCLSASTLYGADINEGKKQIEALNQKIKDAGEKGDLQAAITAAEEALDKSAQFFGDESAEKAKALNNVANLYMFAGHALDAERLYKEAILIEAERFGTDSLEIADSYFNLAMAYAAQKKYDEARNVLKKTLHIRTEKLGGTHAETQKVNEVMKQIWDETPSAPQ